MCKKTVVLKHIKLKYSYLITMGLFRTNNVYGTLKLIYMRI